MALRPAKFVSYDQALAYVNSLPISAIVDGYAQLLYESERMEPIKITREQFERMFRIVGVREDGEPERRGRKRKEV